MQSGDIISRRCDDVVGLGRGRWGSGDGEKGGQEAYPTH